MRRPDQVNSFLSYSNAARPAAQITAFLRTLFVRATSSVHRRPTGGAAEAALCVLALTSYFQFRRLALLPFALCLESVAPCQLGSSILIWGCYLGNGL